MAPAQEKGVRTECMGKPNALRNAVARIHRENSAFQAHVPPLSRPRAIALGSLEANQGSGT